MVTYINLENVFSLKIADSEFPQTRNKKKIIYEIFQQKQKKMFLRNL